MTLMIMASYKIFYLLLISCHVWYELCPFYHSEAASLPPTNTTASASQGKGGISWGTVVAIVVPISVAVLIFIVGICCFSKRTRKKYDSDPEEQSAIGICNVDSLQYDFHTIEAATNKFSADNKLGEGGFGEVYKGKLANGKEVAVKRLSRDSQQGVQEFKNEVEMLAKLKHRNLVRLLGFCVQGEKKILVYEYVLNKSLDYILFDLERKRELDWAKRYKIVREIVRGIQYLHEDSTLRIIHRDINASNILLDSDINPKISDFGFAVLYIDKQTHEDTYCFTGTLNYISPEYAMHGEFSMKSDVYSFGVLLMEIISGKKNFFVSHMNGVVGLLSYAWILWENGEPLELLDPTIRESCTPNEVMRCIHIGLLCVQKDPAHRPSISSILLMLEYYSMTLPTPSQPAFFDQNVPRDFQFGQSSFEQVDTNVRE